MLNEQWSYEFERLNRQTGNWRIGGDLVRLMPLSLMQV
jgi:hypothetical protein